VRDDFQRLQDILDAIEHQILRIEMPKMVSSIMFLCWLAVGTSCAQYRYSIAQPAEFAQEIERRGEAAIAQPPLEYAFIDNNESLSVRIANTTDAPILIIGERSYVVDPDGQTHQMNGGTIAPKSYVAFPLPPSSRVYRSGPRFGIGMGIGSGGGGTFFGTGVGTTWGGYPHHHYDSFSTVSAWRWSTGNVRLHTEYEHNEQRFEHDFLLRRERVE
jgi:hypothetical protein